MNGYYRWRLLDLLPPALDREGLHTDDCEARGMAFMPGDHCPGCHCTCGKSRHWPYRCRVCKQRSRRAR